MHVNTVVRFRHETSQMHTVDSAAATSAVPWLPIEAPRLQICGSDPITLEEKKECTRDCMRKEEAHNIWVQSRALVRRGGKFSAHFGRPPLAT